MLNFYSHRTSNSVINRRCENLKFQDEDDDEDDNFEPSDYMSKLQDIMAHVKPATPSPGPTPGLFNT